MTVPEAWANWPLLKDFPWSYFITATFPNKASQEQAAKTWRVFASKLARKRLSARQAREKGIPWVRAVEQHQNGGAHIHALISDATPDDIKALWKSLVSKDAIIDVSRFDKDRDAIAYLAKEGDIEIGAYFNT